jgi:hypothetical protein
MLNPLLERAFAPVGQLLEIDFFENLEAETFGAVKVPGGLKRLFVSTPCRSANVRRVQIVERSGAAPTHCSSVTTQRIAYMPATGLRSL